MKPGGQLRRVPFPARTVPLERRAGLEARTPLTRTPGIPRASKSLAARNERFAAMGRPVIRPVSAKRARENRERAAMADRRWPDRREGTVMCGCGRPDCNRRADDLNEILPRGRGGSVTDEANVVPLSRHCHDEITFRPESELGWAYKAGLIHHDKLCCRGRKVCASYAEDGGAA